MKTLKKYIIPAALSIMLIFAAAACTEEVAESHDNLHSGYWMDMADAEAPLMSFNADNAIFRYIFHYEAGEDLYYAYYDTSANGRYMIDKANATLCMLPDSWYDIYVLTASRMVLAPVDGEPLSFSKIPEEKVRIITSGAFHSKYPDE